jgi:hypothetical protein
MYSPRVLKCVEAAKLKLPVLDQIELFKQYFEIANPHITKIMFEPGEEIPEKLKYFTGQDADYIEKLTSSENHRIQFFTSQGDLFINAGNREPQIEFLDRATFNGIFIKNTYIGEVDGFMYSGSTWLIDSLDSHSDLYTPFQTFLKNNIFKPTRVNLPERLVCLPKLQWSESDFAYKLVDNYYCLDSEITEVSRSGRIVIERV